MTFSFSYGTLPFGKERAIVVHRKAEDLVFFGIEGFQDVYNLIERVWIEARQDAQVPIHPTSVTLPCFLDFLFVDQPVCESLAL